MIGIITLPNETRYNYGGVLQNYALCAYLRNAGYEVRAVHCASYSPANEIILALHEKLGICLELQDGRISIRRESGVERQRDRRFREFVTKKIRPDVYQRYSEKTYRQLYERYDIFIVGSDQVWNPFWAVNRKTARTYFLNFFGEKRKVSYAASIGAGEIPEEKRDLFRRGLSDFDFLSVREETGAGLVFDLIGRRPEVLPDPTMLLTAETWRGLEKCPSHLKENHPYILKYFLGEQIREVTEEMEFAAKVLDCGIRDLSRNPKNEDYGAGPAEFLYLIDHAQVIYTDSFHALVFAILFHRPYVVFRRREKGEKQEGTDMFSRIETLLRRLNLAQSQVRRIGDRLVTAVDFSEADQILGQERQKAADFLRKACEMVG